MRLSIRLNARFTAGVVCTALLAGLPLSAEAEPNVWTHATSLQEEPSYEADFEHFDYVNPDAPKGGQVRLSATGSFDTLNPVPDKGTLGSGLGLVHETLMTPSLDEADISAQYGLLASETYYPEDYSYVSFRLDEDAAWHDGVPVTVEDVLWSFDVQRNVSEQTRAYYANVVEAEETGEREVTFRFDTTGNRELPHILGQLLVLPKHYWTADDRDIEATTLDFPLGSGPYRVADIDPGRTITYERVPDYWGVDVPVNVGKHNFDRVVYEYYRDRTASMQAFKAGDYDYRAENSAKRWATEYDFPAARAGFVETLVKPDTARGVMQGFYFNLRDPKFQDARVREAFDLAYDFETLNRTNFYGTYERVESYFAGSDLASSGLPQGEELEILEAVRDQADGEGIPESVFTEEYKSPVAGDQRSFRTNLRRATQLLKEAGYTIQNGTLTDPGGGAVRVEFLIYSPDSERNVLPYVQNLERLGVESSVRLVDIPQYLERLRNRDFDITTWAQGQSLSPGNEQREYWGSEAADRPGSRNYMGIKNPAVDALIDRVIFADDRETLIAATRALDRVLLHNHYVVPQFFYPYDRIAYWDRFGFPDPLPEFSAGFPTIWWYDEEAARNIAAGT